MRKMISMLAVVLVASVLAGGSALAEIKIGTNGDDTIVGTNAADHITGKYGNDTLKGLAGNDTYHFAQGFGGDRLVERAFVKVGDRRIPGGTDTLSFSGRTAAVEARLIPTWAAHGWNRATVPDNFVELGNSPVENVVGGADGDTFYGGGARNSFKGGPGGNDIFYDYGGNDGGAVGQPELPNLPASDDVYKGFTSGAGVDAVIDHAGTADTIDLRPLESSDVYFDAFDNESNGTIDSLELTIDATTSVLVIGHFGPVPTLKQQDGRIEQIVFANETITSAAEARSLVQASAREGENGAPEHRREITAK